MDDAQGLGLNQPPRDEQFREKGRQLRLAFVLSLLRRIWCGGQACHHGDQFADKPAAGS